MGKSRSERSIGCDEVAPREDDVPLFAPRRRERECTRIVCKAMGALSASAAVAAKVVARSNQLVQQLPLEEDACSELLAAARPVRVLSKENATLLPDDASLGDVLAVILLSLCERGAQDSDVGRALRFLETLTFLFDASESTQRDKVLRDVLQSSGFCEALARFTADVLFQSLASLRPLELGASQRASPEDTETEEDGAQPSDKAAELVDGMLCAGLSRLFVVLQNVLSFEAELDEDERSFARALVAGGSLRRILFRSVDVLRLRVDSKVAIDRSVRAEMQAQLLKLWATLMNYRVFPYGVFDELVHFFARHPRMGDIVPFLLQRVVRGDVDALYFLQLLVETDGFLDVLAESSLEEPRDALLEHVIRTVRYHVRRDALGDAAAEPGLEMLLSLTVHERIRYSLLESPALRGALLDMLLEIASRFARTFPASIPSETSAAGAEDPVLVAIVRGLAFYVRVYAALHDDEGLFAALLLERCSSQRALEQLIMHVHDLEAHPLVREGTNAYLDEDDRARFGAFVRSLERAVASAPRGRAREPKPSPQRRRAVTDILARCSGTALPAVSTLDVAARRREYFALPAGLVRAGGAIFGLSSSTDEGSGTSGDSFSKLRRCEWTEAALRYRKLLRADEVPVCACVRVAGTRAGCSDDRCLNRSMLVECDPHSCPTGDLCENQRFQRRTWANVRCARTPGGKRGRGLFARTAIPADTFVIEYLGEVIVREEMERRARLYSSDTNHYILAVDEDLFIDATRKGSVARFLNHSCAPNCSSQIWSVRGEKRVGFFTTRDISAGEELTFDYNFETHAFASETPCHCGASTCRGVLGRRRGGSSSVAASPQRLPPGKSPSKRTVQASSPARKSPQVPKKTPAKPRKTPVGKSPSNVGRVTTPPSKAKRPALNGRPPAPPGGSPGTPGKVPAAGSVRAAARPRALADVGAKRPLSPGGDSPAAAKRVRGSPGALAVQAPAASLDVSSMSERQQLAYVMALSQRDNGQITESS